MNLDRVKVCAIAVSVQNYQNFPRSAQKYSYWSYLTFPACAVNMCSTKFLSVLMYRVATLLEKSGELVGPGKVRENSKKLAFLVCRMFLGLHLAVSKRLVFKKFALHAFFTKSIRTPILCSDFQNFSRYTRILQYLPYLLKEICSRVREKVRENDLSEIVATLYIYHFVIV